MFKFDVVYSQDKSKIGINMKIYEYLKKKARFIKQIWFGLEENHDFDNFQYKLFRKLLIITFTYEEYINKTRINKTLEILRIFFNYLFKRDIFASC